MSAKMPELMPDTGEEAENDDAQGQRLDRWLWFTRLVKTRTLAAKFVESGKVRVNSVRITKPARIVRSGDVITATLHRRLHVVKVLSAGDRRGPATEAQTLYEDLTPKPIDGEKQTAHSTPAAAREPGSGRPTKRDRRKLDRLRF